jgi:outer membrane protein assembly factor BamB
MTRRRIPWLALALICTLMGGSARAQSGDFSLAWQRYGEGGWAEHPILHAGVVYVPWTDRKVTAIDLATGEVLHSLPGVNNSIGTAPFIAGNSLYSYGEAGMYEIALDTFEISRTIPISSAWYTENVPYDAETGYFFVRQATDQYKGRVTAVRLVDGAIVWSYPKELSGGFENHQNVLVVGDSVFFQATNPYWQGQSKFYRLNKRTGEEIWAKPLSSIAIDDTSRGGYNNPIYDEDHDAIYVTETWNDQHARLYVFRPSDGELLWSKDFPGWAIESTLSYYDGVLYLPLHNFNGSGSYMALSVTDRQVVWEEPGFFNEDGWSATAVDDRYLYRATHGGEDGNLIVQDRLDGTLAWSLPVDDPAVCFNPVLSNGMVVLGGGRSVYAIQASVGQAVDSDYHGKNATGYNPGAIYWGTVERLYLPYMRK